MSARPTQLPPRDAVPNAPRTAPHSSSSSPSRGVSEQQSARPGSGCDCGDNWGTSTGHLVTCPMALQVARSIRRIHAAEDLDYEAAERGHDDPYPEDWR